MSADSAVGDPQAAKPSAFWPDWFVPSFTYDGAVLGNAKGGARRGLAYAGNLHLKLTLSRDDPGVEGTMGYIDLMTVHGNRPIRFVGDEQGTSNLDGPAGTVVEELWIQHFFAGPNVSVLAGIYDLNSEFDRLQSSGLFLNSAFGVDPSFAQSGVDGPSIFPRTSAGVRLAFKPTASSVFHAAVFDGAPAVRADGSRAVFRSGDGVLGVLEAALLTRPDVTSATQTRDRLGRSSGADPYDDKIAFGVWRYSGRYPEVGGTDPAGHEVARRGSSGAYLIAERLLMGRHGASSERLSGFARVGVADSRTNRFAVNFGAGLVGSGGAWTRDTDQIGVSVTQARNGNRYLRGQGLQGVPGAPESSAQPTSDRPRRLSRAETTFEVTYLAQVSPHLALQPDFQYVVHPDTNRDLAAAWVLQLRFEWSF